MKRMSGTGKENGTSKRVQILGLHIKRKEENDD
jgi:hypothetical protein